LEGIDSLKAAVVRARAIKEIQEECYDRGRGNLNFARQNFLEKKNQKNKKVEEEREDEKKEWSLKIFCTKIKLTIRAERSVGSAVNKVTFVSSVPVKRETRIS